MQHREKCPGFWGLQQLPANMTTPWDIDFPTPLRSSANAALNAAAITSGASIYLDAQGYTAP